MERNSMLQRIPNFVQGEYKRFARFATAIVAALSLGCSFAPTFAQNPAQQTFASTQDAAHALFVAMQPQDEQSPLSVLGPTAKEVLSSGAPTEDASARVAFWSKAPPLQRSFQRPKE